MSPLIQHDTLFLAEYQSLMGVDEAGRGALAGPVVAAAFYCNAASFKEIAASEEAQRINDSKQLKAAEREVLAKAIEDWQVRQWVRIAWAEAGSDFNDMLRMEEAA